MEGKTKRPGGLARSAGEKGSGNKQERKGIGKKPFKIKSSVVIIKGFLKIACTGFKMLFLSLNLIILRGWEQLCTAQPAGDRTGSRFKVIAHPFLTFPRVNYTEHGAREEPRGLRSCVPWRLVPFSWRGREPARASLPRPLIFLFFSCTFPAISAWLRQGPPSTRTTCNETTFKGWH